MPTTSTFRVSTAVRAAPVFLLAFALVLLCGACVPSVTAGSSGPAGSTGSAGTPVAIGAIGAAGGAPPPQPRAQQPGEADGAYETVRLGDGAFDAPTGARLHRDRRRAAATPTGPPGTPTAVDRTAPRTDPPTGRRETPDTRPRPRSAVDPSTLQVFLC